MRWKWKAGSSRLVLLTNHSAWKIPRPDRWRRLLTGLLANMDEVALWSQRLPRLCPIRWSLPGGLLVVMVRADPMPPEEIDTALEEYLDESPKVQLPELKRDALGKIKGGWVIVDYGNVY